MVRLVVRGSQQKENIAYNYNFFTTYKANYHEVGFMYSYYREFANKKMDMKIDSLYGDLDIYIWQSESFMSQCNNKLVYKLQTSSYNFNQAPR